MRTDSLTLLLPTPEETFSAQLAAVFGMAVHDATPKMCAAAYRRLALEHPNHSWLADYANRWETLGEIWK